jgi:hypothetical protein
MTSVFGNVFRMSGGASVWGNVFVLEEATQPVDGWRAETRSRHFVPQGRSRLLIAEPKTRFWIARVNNE